MGRLKEVRNHVTAAEDAGRGQAQGRLCHGTACLRDAVGGKGKIRSFRIFARCFTIWPRMRADPMTITRTGEPELAKGIDELRFIDGRGQRNLSDHHHDDKLVIDEPFDELLTRTLYPSHDERSLSKPVMI